MVERAPLRISDLERITGIRRSTIHYYTREGLLPPPRRTGRTMAYYDMEHAERLSEITRLRGEGYPIAYIKEKLGVSAPGRAAGPGSPETSGRRQQIMEKAVELFARRGYHQTKVSDITRAVGVGSSTFYIYFPSKKALFMECVDSVFQAMFADVWEEIKGVKHPLQRLRKRGEVVLKSHPQFIDILSVLRGIAEDDPKLERRRREIYASIVEPVKRDLGRAMKQGLIPEMDVEVAAYITTGFLETASLLLSLDERFTPDSLMDAYEGMFYRAVMRGGHKP